MHRRRKLLTKMAAPVEILTCKIFILFAIIYSVYGVEQPSEGVVTLNYTTWRQALEGEWFVEFFAPWCPSCRGFVEKYEEFAKHAPTYNVKVAKIDITVNPALSGRFLVTSLPTIFYIRKGATRLYKGKRGLQDLINYLRNEEWKATQPIKWYKSPDSFLMTVVSWFFELSVVIRELHEKMTQEFNIPSWGSYLIFGVLTLIAGLVLGLFFVLLCDCLCPPKPRGIHGQPLNQTLIEEEDEEDEDEDEDDSDVIEDTETKEDSTESEEEKPETQNVRKRKPRKDT